MPLSLMQWRLVLLSKPPRVFPVSQHLALRQSHVGSVQEAVRGSEVCPFRVKAWRNQCTALQMASFPAAAILRPWVSWAMRRIQSDYWVSTRRVTLLTSGFVWTVYKPLFCEDSETWLTFLTNPVLYPSPICSLFLLPWIMLRFFGQD